MSPVGFLVIGAVVLFIFCALIRVGLIAGGCYFMWKKYVAQRRYDLIERGLDRDKAAGLKEVQEAIRCVDGDLHGGHHGDTNIAHQRVASTSDDDSLPSSGSVLRSLPAVTPPDEQFRKK